jgi:hypothetical protein
LFSNGEPLCVSRWMLLFAAQPWDPAARPIGAELPTVVTALEVGADHPADRERNIAVRASIQQCPRYAVLPSEQRKRHPEHSAGEDLATAKFLARARDVPIPDELEHADGAGASRYGEGGFHARENNDSAALSWGTALDGRGVDS